MFSFAHGETLFAGAKDRDGELTDYFYNYLVKVKKPELSFVLTCCTEPKLCPCNYILHATKTMCTICAMPHKSC